MATDPFIRFWRLVRVLGPDDCWEFQGQKNNAGYGQFRVGSKQTDSRVSAHRYAYECVYGPIPPGSVVMHRCDNRPCCNPGHLALGTQSTNLLDASAKGG